MVEVVNLKLISGEEIISLSKSSTDMVLVLSKPLSFVMQYNPDSNSRGDVAFAPWMIGKDMNTDVPVSKSHILAMCEASAEAKNAYLDAIGYREETVVPTISRRGVASTPIGSHRSAPQASA